MHKSMILSALLEMKTAWLALGNFTRRTGEKSKLKVLQAQKPG